MKALARILAYAQRRRDAPVALATLVRTHGSTYRKPGARMLITPEGDTIGVLSGGCLEEAIAQDGLQVLNDGHGRMRYIDTKQFFGCEGRLEIFVERIEAAGEDGNVLTHLADLLDQRVSACICTKFSGSQQGSTLELSMALRTNAEEVFIQRVPLPIRLLVFGRGPEIEPLAALADTLGWVMKAFDHPGECSAEVKGDPYTAALIMNHHFGRDVEALMRTLNLSLPYVGVLGPKRRTNQLMSYLLDETAATPRDLDAIHAPAGLDIGSETPEEIVLSISAEILAILSGHQAGFLSRRQEADFIPYRAELKEA